MTGIVATAASPSRRVHAWCAECDAVLPASADAGGFCCAACRHAFNNRRKSRGAELYDLFMACRFERTLASKLRLWGCLARLASGFRDEDARQRAGRRSWRPPGEVLERRPYLTARVLVRGRITAARQQAREGDRRMSGEAAPTGRETVQ